MFVIRRDVHGNSWPIADKWSSHATEHAHVLIGVIKMVVQATYFGISKWKIPGNSILDWNVNIT